MRQGTLKLQCEHSLGLSALIHHFTSHFSITLSLSPPLTLSQSPFGVSVSLCVVQLQGLEALRVLIGLGLMLSDWWETCDSQTRSWPGYTQPPTTCTRTLTLTYMEYSTSMHTPLQYVGSKHIHTNEHTLDYALMHKSKCMYTHLNGYHTHARVSTLPHKHTPLGVPPDTLNLSQLKPRGPRLRVRRAETVHWAQQSLS